jgi:hypothetical protein
VRRARPARTPPGPSSQNSEAPAAAALRMQSSQRTGETTWRTSAALISGSADGFPGRVGEDPEPGLPERDIREEGLEGGPRRLHEAAVVGPGDIEGHDFLIPRSLAAATAASIFALLARDDDLARGVEIGRLDVELPQSPSTASRAWPMIAAMAPALSRRRPA